MFSRPSPSLGRVSILEFIKRSSKKKKLAIVIPKEETKGGNKTAGYVKRNGRKTEGKKRGGGWEEGRTVAGKRGDKISIKGKVREEREREKKRERERGREHPL